MNKRFFTLPEEKQQAIINAGYRVFSQNSYKKSPMSEVADAAGISKSLLFHYFHNKQEFYLFLWKKCEQITMEYLIHCGCCEQSDLFECMYRGLQAKVRIMKRYPDMGRFALKVYYEKDPAVRPAIQSIIQKYGSYNANASMLRIDPAQFVPGIDLKMMYQDMFWATEGYLWEISQRDELDADQIERDFLRMLQFWKSIYLRKEE